MAFQLRKFRTLSESKAKVIKDFFREKKKTRLEERVLDRRIDQAVKDFGSFGSLSSPTPNGLITSKLLNRNLESMFYDAAGFKEALSVEDSVAKRVSKRLENERTSNEREVFRFEKLLKESMFELDQQAKVAYETFMDSSLGAPDGPRIVEDPKTGLTIPETYRIDPEGRAGLRLPAESVEEIRFRDCSYVYEETDFSPFELEQAVEDPSGVYLEDRVFRHTVIKPTNWRQTKEAAYLTLLCDLPGYQVINTINISSLSEKPVEVSRISYRTADGDWSDMDFRQELSADNRILFFSAIGTNQLKFYFIQKTPSASGQIKVAKKRTDVFVEAEKFEFVIAEIWAQRIWYKDIGFYLTPEFEVNRAVSFSVRETMIDVRGEQGDSFSTGAPSTDTLVDKYFVIKSDKRSNIKVDCVIPAPSDGREEEVLSVYKQEALLNFVPVITEEKCHVYEDGTLLTLGTDYEISLDNGVSWISSYVDANLPLFTRNIPKAYEAKVRMLAYNVDALYTVSYVKRAYQTLDRSGHVTLINNRIGFPRRTKSFSGEVSVLYVLRSMSGNPLITPLITSYCFIAKEKSHARNTQRAS